MDQRNGNDKHDINTVHKGSVSNEEAACHFASVCRLLSYTGTAFYATVNFILKVPQYVVIITIMRWNLLINLCHFFVLQLTFKLAIENQIRQHCSTNRGPKDLMATNRYIRVYTTYIRI